MLCVAGFRPGSGNDEEIVKWEVFLKDPLLVRAAAPVQIPA